VLAQKLDPVLHLGKAGLTDAFLAGAEQALNDHELIKIKFAAFKEERKSLAAEWPPAPIVNSYGLSVT